MGRLKRHLGVEGVIYVPRDGKAGGLCLIWRDGLPVTFLLSSLGHIDARVGYENQLIYRLTNFYGHPKQSLRQLSWELLRNLSNVDHGPWLCCGDFNEVLSISEKTGDRLRPTAQIEEFRRAIEDVGLQEFEFWGYEFTWSNKRKNDENVNARLDRAFGNRSFHDLFGLHTSHYLTAYSSDHHPILISADVNPAGGR